MVRRFSAFFRENYSLVVSVAEHRLGSLPDAEEVAVEAFRISWEAYQDGKALSVPWLYGVVRNLIGNEYRSRSRRARLQERVNEEFATALPVSDETYADLRDAVERLPVEYREVLKMTYWEDLTSREVATVLGVSAVAVRTRLLRARRLLKTQLTELDNTQTEEVTRR